MKKPVEDRRYRWALLSLNGRSGFPLGSLWILILENTNHIAAFFIGLEKDGIDAILRDVFLVQARLAQIVAIREPVLLFRQELLHFSDIFSCITRVPESNIPTISPIVADEDSGF